VLRQSQKTGVVSNHRVVCECVCVCLSVGAWSTTTTGGSC